MYVNKISIIGAGHVGSNTAFLLLAKKLCKELVLVDIQKDLARGISLDLQDSRFFLEADVSVSGTDDFQKTEGSDIVIVTAGKPRSPGMSREDLIKVNSGIIKEIGKKVKRFTPNAILIHITNPLDLMTYVLLKETGFDPKKIIGMGSGLDSSRLANLISEKANISITSITPYVFGAHGKKMLVSCFSAAEGLQLDQFLDHSAFQQIKKETVNRGATIVGLLGSGSARFGPAVSCSDLVKSIVYDKHELSLGCVYLTGQYNMEDVCLGMPIVVGRPGVERVIELNLPESEKNILEQAKNTFQDQIKLV